MAWVFAVCNVLNRKLKNLNFLLVLFAHGSVGLLMAICYILGEKLITGNDFRFYTAYQYGIIILCCCFDFIALSSAVLAF